MKVGIISDAHIPHWFERWGVIAERIRASIDKAKPDLLIDASDMMADADAMASLQQEWNVPIVSVRGNHDYYHKIGLDRSATATDMRSAASASRRPRCGSTSTATTR